MKRLDHCATMSAPPPLHSLFKCCLTSFGHGFSKVLKANGATAKTAEQIATEITTSNQMVTKLYDEAVSSVKRVKNTLVSSVVLHLLHSFRVNFYIFFTRFE